MKKGNNEGSIYYSDKRNCYIGQYTEPYTHKRKTIYQRKNERVTDFKARFTNIIASINQNTYVKDASITLYDILEDYIENKHKTGITKDRTYLRNKESLKLLNKLCKDFINKNIQKITSYDIKESLPNFTPYAQTVIDKEFALLKKGFSIAISDRLITFNVMDNILKPKSQKETKKVEALTIEEEKNLIDVLQTDNKYNDIILLGLYTGLRIGEILALSFDNLGVNTITVEKTLTLDINGKVIMGKTTKTETGRRVVYLDDNAKKVVNKLKKSKLTNIYNLVFFDYNKNTFITPNEVNCYLKRLNDKYKICNNLHCHILRHTYATRCIEAGMNAKVLQNQLGHKKISTTLDTYTTVFNKFNQDENNKLNSYYKKLGL